MDFGLGSESDSDTSEIEGDINNNLENVSASATASGTNRNLDTLFSLKNTETQSGYQATPMPTMAAEVRRFPRGHHLGIPISGPKTPTKHEQLPHTPQSFPHILDNINKDENQPTKEYQLARFASIKNQIRKCKWIPANLLFEQGISPGSTIQLHFKVWYSNYYWLLCITDLKRVWVQCCDIPAIEWIMRQPNHLVVEPTILIPQLGAYFSYPSPQTISCKSCTDESVILNLLFATSNFKFSWDLPSWRLEPKVESDFLYENLTIPLLKMSQLMSHAILFSSDKIQNEKAAVDAANSKFHPTANKPYPIDLVWKTYFQLSSHTGQKEMSNLWYFGNPDPSRNIQPPQYLVDKIRSYNSPRPGRSPGSRNKQTRSNMHSTMPPPLQHPRYAELLGGVHALVTEILYPVEEEATPNAITDSPVIQKTADLPSARQKRTRSPESGPLIAQDSLANPNDGNNIVNLTEASESTKPPPKKKAKKKAKKIKKRKKKGFL